jgi:hypothetical protein
LTVALPAKIPATHLLAALGVLVLCVIGCGAAADKPKKAASVGGLSPDVRSRGEEPSELQVALGFTMLIGPVVVLWLGRRRVRRTLEQVIASERVRGNPFAEQLFAACDA